MWDSDYYPPGAANDPNAPYNQVDPEPIDVETTVTYTMVNKEVVVSTEDYLTDEDGGVDIEDSALSEAYKDGSLYTLPELLEKVTEAADTNMKRIKKKMDEYKDKHQFFPSKLLDNYYKWKKIYDSANGWEEDDFYIEKR